MQDQSLALVMTADRASADVFRMVLPRYGLSVEVISNGREALARLGQSGPMLLVLDLQLPGVSGLELLAHLSGESRLASTRIFMLTADVVCGHLTGRQVDATLLQPVSPGDVIEALDQLPEFSMRS